MFHIESMGCEDEGELALYLMKLRDQCGEDDSPIECMLPDETEHEEVSPLNFDHDFERDYQRLLREGF